MFGIEKVLAVLYDDLRADPQTYGPVLVYTGSNEKNGRDQ